MSSQLKEACFLSSYPLSSVVQEGNLKGWHLLDFGILMCLQEMQNCLNFGNVFAKLKWQWNASSTKCQEFLLVLRFDLSLLIRTSSLAMLLHDIVFVFLIILQQFYMVFLSNTKYIILHLHDTLSS